MALKKLLSICLVAFTLIVNAQEDISDNSIFRDSILNSALSYPDNFDKAFQLMKQQKGKNQPELIMAIGNQALEWAKGKEDNHRIQKLLKWLTQYHITNGAYERADSVCNIGLYLMKPDTSKASFYLFKIRIQLRTFDWVDTDFYFSEARKLIGTDTLTSAMAEYYNVKGLYHIEKDRDWYNALVMLHKAKRIPGLSSTFVSNINQALSIIYLEFDDYERIEKMCLENLEIARQNNSPVNELFIHYALASSAFEQEKFEEAIDVGHNAIHLRQETGMSAAFGWIYYIMGDAFQAMNQLDSADHYFQLGLDISKMQNDGKELIDCLAGMVRLRVKQKKYQEAVDYGEQILELGSFTYQEFENDLAAAYHALGQTHKAYQMLQLRIKREENEEEVGIDMTIFSNLLEQQFQLENEQDKKNYEQQLVTERLNTTIFVLALLLFLGLLGFYQQYNSREKLKKLNHSLTKSNASLQHFAYITSHDLKENIRNIASFSGLLNREIKNREHSQNEEDYLDFISKNTTVLQEIVESLQTYTQISFGNLALEYVSLPDVFASLRQNLNQVLEEKNGQLDIINPDQIEEVVFSRSMLILILQNLVHNGFKYNDSGHPKVVISISRKDEKTLFKVQDDGKGIKAEYFDYIFSPFKTLENKTITQSSGLGLSICKNILERYDKQIWVESDGENGSAFFFEI